MVSVVVGESMRVLTATLCAALIMSGCATGIQHTKDVADLTSKDTLDLCKIALSEPEEAYRIAAAKLAVRRGASLDKCQRLIANDQAIMTGIVVVGAAAAAGAASSGSYGSSYGVAWDRFSNGQWRCRDKASGRFVPDYRCASVPMYDAWP